MFTSTNLGISNLPSTPASAVPAAQTSSVSTHQSNQVASGTETEPQIRKSKGSAQLNRWSRARAVRSGRKLDLHIHRDGTAAEKTPSAHSSESTSPVSSPTAVGGGEEVEAEVRKAKSIYMVSDGTGWTAEHAVNAALGQFDHCLIDRGCPVNTHLFSGVNMSF
ncbi:Transferase of phosphorus-containing groups [Sarracenia purpurea var. burkii]